MKVTFNNIFHYNEYTEKWSCFNREDYNAYWNKKDTIKVGEGETPNEAHMNLKQK